MVVGKGKTQIASRSVGVLEEKRKRNTGRKRKKKDQTSDDARVAGRYQKERMRNETYGTRADRAPATIAKGLLFMAPDSKKRGGDGSRKEGPSCH